LRKSSTSMGRMNSSPKQTIDMKLVRWSQAGSTNITNILRRSGSKLKNLRGTCVQVWCCHYILSSHVWFWFSSSGTHPAAFALSDANEHPLSASARIRSPRRFTHQLRRLDTRRHHHRVSHHHRRRDRYHHRHNRSTSRSTRPSPRTVADERRDVPRTPSNRVRRSYCRPISSRAIFRRHELNKRDEAQASQDEE
jgi:hypothetical protein